MAFRVGFFFFFHLLGPEFATTAACRQLFLVPYNFFVLGFSEEACPSASIATLQQRSQVPACLHNHNNKSKFKTKSHFCLSN